MADLHAVSIGEEVGRKDDDHWEANCADLELGAACTGLNSFVHCEERTAADWEEGGNCRDSAFMSKVAGCAVLLA